jgi:hypothetical protein
VVAGYPVAPTPPPGFDGVVPFQFDTLSPDQAVLAAQSGVASPGAWSCTPVRPPALLPLSYSDEKVANRDSRVWRDRKRSMNDGRMQNPSNPFGIVPLFNFEPRGFGFGHHSIAILYHEVPNPNITIRNFFIAVCSLCLPRREVGGQSAASGHRQGSPRASDRAGGNAPAALLGNLT